jgi:hypothetical protein
MSAEKQKHDRNASWDEPFNCDYHATKGPDILIAVDLNYGRRCVLACADLNPEAVPQMMEALEFYAKAIPEKVKSKGYIARTALAAAKKVGE